MRHIISTAVLLIREVAKHFLILLNTYLHFCVKGYGNFTNHPRIIKILKSALAKKTIIKKTSKFNALSKL